MGNKREPPSPPSSSFVLERINKKFECQTRAIEEEEEERTNRV
jgi:hypothetical protein